MQGIGNMGRYISLLRGINITGYNLVKMPVLIELYKSLGFQNIETYLQSGNVVFNTDMSDIDKISGVIENEIKKKLGLSIRVLIKTGRDFKKIIKNNPFVKKVSDDTKSIYVTLLFEKPGKDLLSAIDEINPGKDEYYIIGDTIYINCPYGYGRTKLNNNVFEKKLKVTATTRNWNTVNMLYKMCEMNK